ncbi:MAG: adenylate/guanylate cyclase domain-containing protein [Oculatellaceae cyanobacterium Prado106]|nr:adenylate/guanylate cyclase domain-containing protein [Oculatellaceae cyanobacterium Prado106]
MDGSCLGMGQSDLGRRNTAIELERLLKKRRDYPEYVTSVDAEIKDQFMETYAVLILDMSGFSRLVEEFFIIHTLTQIQQMREIMVPLVERYQGTVIKLEADNVYAVFPGVDQAVVGAIAMLQQLAEQKIHASIGIGYGELIMIANEGGYCDAFGNQMNLASKLGEDLAQADEILMTEAAFQAQQNPSEDWQIQEMAISGLKLQVYRQQVRTAVLSMESVSVA